ncbi:MAG: hypothetical protein M1816_004739 [Peltula sp. TS41687]|nr:MAG: hypothetical protein M1816_004739 [Peltula sp. TS41687]
MAPIRRYLRITRYSVLECRVYLDNPGLIDSWFLNARNPVLPRVIDSIRPLVLPKLREENERSKARGKKTLKGIKDVVVEDDFEVAIFLTEPSTRHHSLLIKQKYFTESRERLGSNSRKLTDPFDEHSDQSGIRRSSPIVLREDDDQGEAIDLGRIPVAPATATSSEVGREGGRGGTSLRAKVGNTSVRQRGRGSPSEVIDLSEGDSATDQDAQSSRQRDRSSDTPEPVEESEDKKKLSVSSSYDGFSIYGRILCLIVKRRRATSARSGTNDGQAMMENWIRSTQLDPEES